MSAVVCRRYMDRGPSEPAPAPAPEPTGRAESDAIVTAEEGIGGRRRKGVGPPEVLIMGLGGNAAMIAGVRAEVGPSDRACCSLVSDEEACPFEVEGFF